MTLPADKRRCEGHDRLTPHGTAPAPQCLGCARRMAGEEDMRANDNRQILWMAVPPRGPCDYRIAAEGEG